MRDIRQDVQKRFSRLRSRSAERLSQRNVASANGASSSERQLHDNHVSTDDGDENYDEEVTPTAGKVVPTSYLMLPEKNRQMSIKVAQK